MYQVVGYHRPCSLPEALQLLASDRCVALAGGVHLRHDGGAEPAEVVDLQAAGLDTLDVAATSARIGAMVRLQALVDEPSLPDVIRSAARLEQPSTLRTLATVGGAIANAGGDSLLLAALLAHDAVVELASEMGGQRSVGLAELLADRRRPGEVIVEVRVQTAGRSAIARTGRTPQDTPIVGVVARRVPGAGRGDCDGDGGLVTLGLCGIGLRPVRIDPAGLSSLQPIDDHRASAAYRSHLAGVLTGRVLEELS